MHTCTHAHIHTRIHARTHTHARMHARTHTRTRTHAHTHTNRKSILWANTMQFQGLLYSMYKLSQFVSTTDIRIHSVVGVKLYQCQQDLHQPSYVCVYVQGG